MALDSDRERSPLRKSGQMVQSSARTPMETADGAEQGTYVTKGGLPRHNHDSNVGQLCGFQVYDRRSDCTPIAARIIVFSIVLAISLEASLASFSNARDVLYSRPNRRDSNNSTEPNTYCTVGHHVRRSRAVEAACTASEWQIIRLTNQAGGTSRRRRLVLHHTAVCS